MKKDPKQSKNWVRTLTPPSFKESFVIVSRMPLLLSPILFIFAGASQAPTVICNQGTKQRYTEPKKHKEKDSLREEETLKHIWGIGHLER